MNAALELDFDVPVADPLWRQKTSAGFQRSRHSPFDNVLGAVDGIAVRQEQPLVSDVPCVADYYSRKGFYAFNVQAICNFKHEFTWMSCGSPGSVHDSTTFEFTTLGRALMDPHHAASARPIEEGYCIVGYEACAAGEVMAVPWPCGGRADTWKGSFNFFQSSTRIHIEQAFGMLVWRWGVFWRPLRVPFVKRPSMVRACSELHNHCRREASSSTSALAPFGKDLVGGSACVFENDMTGPDQRGRRRDRERFFLRARMTARVEQLGLLRPNVSPLY